jgi:uncharacterized protein (UPF0333 family)
MKKQQGAVSMALIGTLVALAVIVLALFMSYVSASNYGNAAEQGIKATYKNNQNIYATYTQKVMEVAQVPEMYRDDISKVTEGAISGRYGKDGSKAVFQAIKEQNPTLDATLYRKIQEVIEGGRTEFQNAQTRLLDQKRSYETNLGYFWKGKMLSFAGYPKIDLDQYDIVTTDKTQAVFASKKENGPLKLR